MKSAIKYRARPPKPVAVEPMNCFAIAWFGTKYQATKYDEIVKRGGKTYLGGAFNGRPCGRDILFDKEINGKMAFAVTFSGELYGKNFEDAKTGNQGQEKSRGGASEPSSKDAG
jgi:hypothetical protein